MSVTRLPYVCKDIAEVLRIYGEDGVRQIIDNAKFPDSPQVVFNRSRVSAIKEVLKGNYDHGYGTGFGPLTDRHLRFTGEGGLIIVTGAPSEGKTSWSRALLCHLMCQRDLGVCFCSFEEPNKDKHVANVVRIAMGTTHPEDMTDEMMDSVIGYLDSRMANISFGNMPPTPNNIIRLCEEVRRRQPVHFLYIDPYLFIEPDRNTADKTGAHHAAVVGQAAQHLDNDSLSPPQTTERPEWEIRDGGPVHHSWQRTLGKPRRLPVGGET